MHSYVETALINAAMIVPLALVAEVAGRLLKRPALTHLLWVLLLVKLVTPPIWQIPLIDQQWVSAQIHSVTAPFVIQTERIDASRRTSMASVGETPRPTKATARPRSRPRTLADQDKRPIAAPKSTMEVVTSVLRSSGFQQLLLTGLMLAWGIGSLIWFAMQGYRCIRFRLSLAQGCAAPPELQQFSDKLAQRLGLPSSPTVWLMPGVMSPMLWGSGESTLLIFPELLLERLEQDAAGTLLTHELAHYRRRDHLVRIVALMATGFFWWHPVVWWARRSIEAVEEECCDALVLRSAAAPAKRYAEAILDTVDFLAEFRLRLPPLATGLGQLPFLRQRLTWIMRGPRKQDLGRIGLILLMSLGTTLAWQPTWIAARTSAPLPPTVVPTTPVPSKFPQSVEPSIHSSDRMVPVEITEQRPLPQENEVKTASRWTGFSVRSQSHDGRFVIMGNKSTQFLLDLDTGREFELTDFGINALAFSPNSYKFVTVSTDRFLRLWDAESCEVVQGWQVPGGPSKSVDISQGGQWIVTGGRDGIIRVWGKSSSEPVWELPRELAPVNCLRFSPDGQLLAAATGDWMSSQSGRIALFDVGKWTERISMNWNSPAAVVAFRNDGESLTSGDWQGRVAKWSIETGELLGLIEGHKDLVAAAEFSPNGSMLAEIPVPDSHPDSLWGEPQLQEEMPWFLNGWKLTTPATPTVPRTNSTQAPR